MLSTFLHLRSPSWYRLERLLEISNDILDILNTNRHPNQIRRDPARELLLSRKLLMRRRRRMNHERLRIAHIRQVARQLQPVDHARADLRVLAALHAEAQHAAERAGAEHRLRELVGRVARQPGVGDPGDFGVRLQVLGEGERVGAVPLGAQREGFEALEEKEGAEGVHARAEVAQDLDAGFDGEGERAEGLAVFQAFAGVRIG